MQVMEFGVNNPEVVMLLHGGGLSWWNYREAAVELARHYHVVLPVLDGHAGSEDPFVSMEENARRLIGYVDRRFGGRIRTLGGLSLGAQIALEVLRLRPEICQCALLESPLVIPMPLTHALLRPSLAMSYGLIRQRWFAKTQAAWLGIPKALFEDYYRDSCAISRESMTAFLEANSAFSLNPAVSGTAARVLIAAGGREQRKILSSAKLLHRTLPGSELRILPGLGHGQLSLKEPRRYARLLREWTEAD